MDAADFFEILERNHLMWEQQWRRACVKATQEWLEAMHPLRNLFLFFWKGLLTRLEPSPTVLTPLKTSLCLVARLRMSFRLVAQLRMSHYPSTL